MTQWALEGYRNAQCKIFEYDFDKEGGAVGNITLRGGKVPLGAVVLGGCILGQTNCASGGAATIALSLEAANDVYSAATFDSFDDGAILDVVPDWTATNMILIDTAGGAPLVMAIATDTLTAGKFRVALFFVQLDDV